MGSASLESGNPSVLEESERNVGLTHGLQKTEQQNLDTPWALRGILVFIGEQLGEFFLIVGVLFYFVLNNDY